MCKDCKRSYVFTRRLKARRVIWLYQKLFGEALAGVQLGNMMKFLKNNCDKKLAISGVSNYKWNEHLANLMRSAINCQFQQTSMCR